MEKPNQYPPTSPASSSDHDVSSVKGMIWFATAMCISTAIVMAFFCSFCRRNRRLRDAGAAAAAAAAGGGLDRDALNAIPVFVYSSDDREGERLECCVCLGEFREHEKGRLLPNCRHSFHVDCVDKWFQLNSTCPLCRSAAGSRTTELKQGLTVV